MVNAVHIEAAGRLMNFSLVDSRGGNHHKTTRSIFCTAQLVYSSTTNSHSSRARAVAQLLPVRLHGSIQLERRLALWAGEMDRGEEESEEAPDCNAVQILTDSGRIATGNLCRLLRLLQLFLFLTHSTSNNSLLSEVAILYVTLH